MYLGEETSTNHVVEQHQKGRKQRLLPVIFVLLGFGPVDGGDKLDNEPSRRAVID